MDIFFSFINKIGISNIIIGVIAFNIGSKFPDWDFAFRLKHRNIVTHSPLIIFILLNVYAKENSEFLRFFVSSFSMGMALHFVFDFFPKGWSRSALLHLPIINLELGKILSISLFSIFILINLYISQKTTISIEEYLLLGFFSLAKLLTDINKEKKFFRPFLLFIFLFVLLGNIKYQNLYKNIVDFSLYLYEAYL